MHLSPLTRSILTSLLLASATLAPTAITAKETDPQAVCANQTILKVNGLVCDFCARSLEKIFGQRDDVAAIQVDLDAGRILLQTKPGLTITNDELTALVRDAGYNVTAIERGC